MTVQLHLGETVHQPDHPFTDLGLERCANADTNPDCKRIGEWDWEQGAVLCDACREQT